MKRWSICLAVGILAGPALADPSLECSVQSSSQVETGQCLIEAEEKANLALEVALNIARENATDLDEVTGRDVALPALEAAQKAWISYKETECDYAGALFGGGSGTGIAIRSCRIEKSRARTSALMAQF